MKKGIYFKKILSLLVVISMAGCANFQSSQQRVIESYARIASQIHLGMDKATVEEILAPSQMGLSPSQSKLSDQYIKGETHVEILYMRSGWQRDGIVTDDEFTPYIFNDGILVAIGWATFEGPKTQAQAVPKEKMFYPHLLMVF